MNSLNIVSHRDS